MRLRELVREIFKEKFPPELVLFRVDAGCVNGLSFGHVSRSKLIADELKRAGAESVFLMRDYEEGVGYVRSFGYKVELIDRSARLKDHDQIVIERISAICPDCLVVDLPFDDPNRYLDHAGSSGIFTVAIDDTCNRFFNADVVLNSSILADRGKYANCPGSTRFLLGMDYFPMQDRRLESRRMRKEGRISALLTFGGSDISGITEKAVKAIAEVSWDNAEFTVILGPGFKDADSVIANSQRLHGKMSVVNFPKDLTSFFYENDLVVCAGGTTLYQACAIGVPCIAIASSEHEALVIERFVATKLVFAGMKRWDKKLFLCALRDFIAHIDAKKYQKVN